MDVKEEVRSRLNIEDVIGEYIPLKRAGRSFRGLSPFTNEKTPSFYVSPEKNIWHDFSSGKGGDIFSFIMEVEGLDFRQSLVLLARKAGVDLSLYENKDARNFAKRKQRLLEAYRLATHYYQHCLVRDQRALEYVFAHRKLSKQIVKEFLIGYAPRTGRALVNYLQKKGFTLHELNDAGLTNRYGGDLFRDRMMVPLMDISGQVIGFTARIVKDEVDTPKYLNTPQTILYDKGRHVFGLTQAKQAIRQQGFVVIVEGNLDVVSSHQAGEVAVVAAAGTALTEHHLRTLKRLTNTVRLAFDSDKAGQAAAERAVGLASRVGVDLFVVTMPDGVKDPDEFIRQRGVTAWQAAIKDAQPAVDWLLAKYQTQLDLTTAAGKRQFTTVGLGVVNQLKDPVEREHYQKQIAKTIDLSLEAVQSKGRQNSMTTVPRKAIKSSKASANQHLNQDTVLALAMLDARSQELFGHIDVQIFAGEQRQVVAANYARPRGTSIDPALQKFDDYITMLESHAKARYSDWSESDRYYEVARLLRQIKNEHKQQQKDRLTNKLRDAEAAGDDMMAAGLRKQLNQLIKEIARDN